MQGSLGEFRLAEILQLVAVQQKTGLLRLVRGEQMVTFYFDRGILVSTRDRRHGSPDPLLDYAARTGWLEPDMAGFLKTRIEGSRDDLADVLLGERFLSEDELTHVLEDLAQELVYKTFAWRSGTYQFIGGEEALGGLQHRISLTVDSLLMEAARRADEWPRWTEKLPRPDVLLELVSTPSPEAGERAFEVLSRIRGRTTVGDLVRQSRISEYEVYEIVGQAHEAGLVRIEVPPAPVAVADDPSTALPRAAGRRTRDVWSLPQPVAWGAALLLALLAIAGPRLTGSAVRSATVRAEQRRAETAEARAAIHLRIEIYRATHGRYPQQLADLVADELAGAALLARAAPLRYTVAPDGRSFRLTVPPAGGESAGP